MIKIRVGRNTLRNIKEVETTVLQVIEQKYERDTFVSQKWK